MCTCRMKYVHQSKWMVYVTLYAMTDCPDPHVLWQLSCKAAANLIGNGALIHGTNKSWIHHWCVCWWCIKMCRWGLTDVIRSKCLHVHDILCAIGAWGSPHVVGMYLDTALSLRGNSVKWPRCEQSSGMHGMCQVGCMIFWCVAIGDLWCLGLGVLMPLLLGSNTSEGLEEARNASV